MEQQRRGGTPGKEEPLPPRVVQADPVAWWLHCPKAASPAGLPQQGDAISQNTDDNNNNNKCVCPPQIVATHNRMAPCAKTTQTSQQVACVAQKKDRAAPSTKAPPLAGKELISHMHINETSFV